VESLPPCHGMINMTFKNEDEFADKFAGPTCRLLVCHLTSWRHNTCNEIRQRVLALERHKWADGSYLVSQEKLSGSPVAASKKEDKNSSTSSG
jgi:hypothetical protein